MLKPLSQFFRLLVCLYRNRILHKLYDIQQEFRNLNKLLSKELQLYNEFFFLLFWWLKTFVLDVA